MFDRIKLLYHRIMKWYYSGRFGRLSLFDGHDPKLDQYLWRKMNYHWDFISRNAIKKGRNKR